MRQGGVFILNFTLKWGKYLVLVMRQGVVFSLFGEIYVRQEGDL